MMFQNPKVSAYQQDQHTETIFEFVISSFLQRDQSKIRLCCTEKRLLLCNGVTLAKQRCLQCVELVQKCGHVTMATMQKKNERSDAGMCARDGDNIPQPPIHTREEHSPAEITHRLHTAAITTKHSLFKDNKNGKCKFFYISLHCLSSGSQ